MKVSPLRSAIQDKTFSSAYYLYGEDEFLKEEALRHVIDAAVDPATRDFNLDQRRGADLDGESLASLLAMPPMMAERRVIVIRDVTSLRKDARAALERYLSMPSSDVLVLLTAPADAKSDKGISELAIGVDCQPLTGAQVPKWIVSRVEQVLGTSITPSAVELLQDAVGADLAQLAIELDKLAAYAGKATIDEDAVGAIVGVRRDETPGMLLDAVAMRDPVRALALLPGVLQQPKIGAVPLVMALTTQMLALAIGVSRSLSPQRLSGEYFQLLRSGSSNLTLRAWGEAVSAWARATAKWSAADIDHALAALLTADVALKQSRVSSEEQVLATAILDVCAGAAMRSAA
ncbi:MAG TPA: DNA polymerase III subunit delta [Gemmatimonadaceae bacterium]|nr:DNA polymerase III subunit delta [Gemmatimonadaceae bacterium]